MTNLRTNSPKELLRNNQFRWLFRGNMSLFFGFSASLLLRSLLAWELTGDEMALAYINLLTATGVFLTSIFSGAVIDRFERRRLMAVFQWVILTSEFIILLLLLTGHIRYEFLLLSCLVSSLSFPFIMPARSAMVVETVGRPSLGNATAIMSGGVNVARMVSPALAGLIADVGNLTYAYMFLVCLHFTSLLCTIPLQPSLTHNGAGNTTFLTEIKEGFLYLFRNKPLAVCMLLGVMPIMILVPVQSLMVVIVENLWSKGRSGVGIMMGAMGVGGLLGSFVMANITYKKLVRPIMFSTIGIGVFLILFVLSPWYWVAVVFVGCAYAASVFSQTLVHTGIQLITEEKYRGRVTTISLMSFGLAPIGTLPIAYAAKTIGSDKAIIIAVAVMFVGLVLLYRLMPAIKLIDQAASTDASPKVESPIAIE